METQDIFHLMQFYTNRPDVLYDVPKMLVSSYGPLALNGATFQKCLIGFYIISKIVIINQ